MRNLLTMGLMAVTLMRNAPEEAGSAPAEAAPVVKPEKKERLRRNGQTRPEVGSKTGLIWDIADKFVEEHNRVPTKDEVWDAYAPTQAEPSQMTLATQYGRWVIFHGYQAHVKANRAAAKAAKEAQEADEKASKAAEKDAEKARKLAEKEAAKKARTAEREAAAAARAAEKAAKAAEKAAKANPAPDNGEADAHADTSDDNADENGDDENEESDAE